MEITNESCLFCNEPIKFDSHHQHKSFYCNWVKGTIFICSEFYNSPELNELKENEGLRKYIKWEIIDKDFLLNSKSYKEMKERELNC